MEILRQTIKTLFSEASGTKVIDELLGDKRGLDTGVDESWFVRSYMNYAHSFTKDQAVNVYRLLKSKWMQPDHDIRTLHFSQANSGSVFNVLLHFTSSVLTEYDNQPVCRYDHLLRWHDISLLLGEDIFTTSYLASLDAVMSNNRTDFCWKDVVDTDNKGLNNLFKKEMIDLHYHLLGSSFVFDLNWISLMNNLKANKDDLNNMTERLYPSLQLTNIENFESLYGRMMKAGAIRLLLFKYIWHSDELSDAGAIWKMVRHLLEQKAIADIDNVLKDADIDYAAQTIDNEVGTFHMDAAQPFDYALTGLDVKDENIYYCLAGERYLMYKMFRDIYSNEEGCSKYHTLFYAYLLLKNEFRREMVQVNGLSGFANFSDYQGRKKFFFKGSKEKIRAAIISSLNGNDKYVEVRIGPKDDVKELRKSIKSIDKHITSFYTKLEEKQIEELKRRWGYVIHFLKWADDDVFEENNCRHYSLRNNVKTQALTIKTWMMSENYEGRIRGIDAASSEINCRPEVFGTAYRYLRGYNPIVKKLKGKSNTLGFTFHVGEDFLDVTDGLRAVREAIIYLNLGNNDRIGHALVLGTDITRYYEKRDMHIAMSKQMLLDNAAWLAIEGQKCYGYYKVLGMLEYVFEKYFREVYGDYDLSKYRPTIRDYYQSWLLRGDAPELYLGNDNIKEINNGGNSYWDMFKLNNVEEVKEARNNEVARKLYWAYHYKKEVRENGSVSDMIKVDDDFITLLKQVQENILCEVERLHIAIECNPTSNYRIGEMERYDQHPILSFFNDGMNVNNCPRHSIPVSINTDDKGVFSISLEREYAVMAAALEKKYIKHQADITPTDIYNWLDKVRTMGMSQMFL